ncbi:MAG: copper-binding protein [Burkholderiales bacterium]
MFTLKGLIAIAATALLKPLAALSSAVAMAIVSTSPSIAQHGTKGTDMGATKSERKAQERVHRAVGYVTSVAPEIAGVVIKHEPVASLDWPAMTMTFTVRDQALFDRMDRGDTISFEFVKSGESYIIIRID